MAGTTPEPADVETVKTTLVKLDQEHQEIGDAVHAVAFRLRMAVDPCAPR